MTAPDPSSIPLPEGVEADGEIEFDGLGLAAWVTDVGHLRGRNEDRLLVKSLWGGDYALLMVADGAGGHDSGDKAAEAVVAGFNAAFPSEGSPPETGDPGLWIQQAINSAHADVKALGQGQSRPPASTAVGIIVERASLCGWRFHVGDSRLYARTGDGMVAQWTRDHNITNGLIDRGLPVTQALKIADGGRLTQVMGGASDPEPEILGPLSLGPGHVFLICSDGVYGHNGDREVLLPAMNPALGTVTDRVQELKAAVLAGDAPDNLTAVLWQVPEKAIATRERETVTNSMKAVTADDIERQLTERVEAAKAPLPPPPGQGAPRRGPSTMVWFVIVIGAVLLLYAAFQDKDDDGRSPTPTASATPGLAAVSATPAPVLEPLPWPEDEERAERLQAVAAGFDPAWWGGLAPAVRTQVVELLTELTLADKAEDTTLSWTESAGGEAEETTYDGWPMPGGVNGELAIRAWTARDQLLADFPELVGQPGIPKLLAEAGCFQVTARWPRGDSLVAGDAVHLATWLEACLPTDLPDRHVLVRLGGWPDRGWTMDELNGVRYQASRAEGGPELRQLDSVENPRLLELGLLGQALASAGLSHLSVELLVVLSADDLTAQTTSDEANVMAQARAVEMATLLRGATGTATPIKGLGSVGDVLASLSAEATPTAEQRARIADLDRRVEVTLWSKAGEELPGEVETENEMPGEPITRDELPSEDQETPGATQTGEEQPDVLEAAPGLSGEVQLTETPAPVVPTPAAETPAPTPATPVAATPTPEAAQPSPPPIETTGPSAPVLLAPPAEATPAATPAPEASPTPEASPEPTPTPELDLDGMR
jgi:PPM family protein phosphatase